MSALTSLIQLPGCAFLFETHLGMTQAAGVASAWADTQSGSAAVAAQADPTKKPRYNAANAAFAGYPTLDWLPADVAAVPFLETGALAMIAAKPLTWLIAIQPTDISALRAIATSRFPQSAIQSALFTATGPFRLTGFSAPGVDSAKSLAVGEVVVLCAVAKPSTGALYKNGNIFGYGPLGNHSLDGVRIGASGFSSGGSFPYLGSIATVGGWPRELERGEIIQGSQFLMSRYGLALPTRRVA